MNNSTLPTVRRLALQGALVPILLGASACTYTIENGQTYSGAASSESIIFGGLTTLPGITVEVQALSSLTTGAKGPGDTWVTVGSAVSGTTPIVNGGSNYYSWTTTVPGIGSAYWPAGGLARMRVQHDGQIGFTFDDFSCLLDDPSLTYSERALKCASHDNGYITLVDQDPIPAAGADFLSFKATAGAGAAYYAAVDPLSVRTTLAQWKRKNKFIGLGSGLFPETNTRYYNEGDLRFGRDMHCKTNGLGRTACYVSNYGDASAGTPNVGDPSGPSLDATIAQDPNGLVATVTMEYNGALATNEVSFYVYDAAGGRVTQAALDSEGLKDVPGLCMACHGGVYDSGTASVHGAKFLPFDLDNFEYDTTAGWTRADQQDEFRTLNEMVHDAGPSAAITELTEGWYDSGSGVDFSAAGPDQLTEFVPSGWSSEKTVYLEVVKPFCRTCHVSFYDSALGTGAADLDFDDVVDFEDSAGSGTYSLLNSYVCASKLMPQAEVTREKFWESSARAHLVGAFNLPTACD
jgi:hypothetical protein